MGRNWSQAKAASQNSLSLEYGISFVEQRFPRHTLAQVLTNVREDTDSRSSYRGMTFDFGFVAGDWL